MCYNTMRRTRLDDRGISLPVRCHLRRGSNGGERNKGCGCKSTLGLRDEERIMPLICLFSWIRGRGPFCALQSESYVSRSVARGGHLRSVCCAHTNRVVFHQAHGKSCARTLERVEEARHGHGEEAHVDQTSFGCRAGIVSDTGGFW